jgi:uncharacterized membrane protein YbhN (UPF0104 family)
MDWVRVRDAFANMRFQYWTAALVIYLASQVVSGLRWKMLARPLGFANTLGHFTALYYVGMFFNLFLPTSVGGDVVRAWYLDRGSGRKMAAFLSVLADRGSGLVVLVLLACGGVLLSPIALPSWVRAIVWATTGSGFLGIVVMLLGCRLHVRSERWRQVSQAGLLYLGNPGLLALTGVLSLVIQAANVSVVWLLGVSINAAVPLSFYWVFVPMVSLLTMLPFSLNGMGIREGSTVLFLTPLGVGESSALCLAFLWFTVMTAASLVGGIYSVGWFPRDKVQTDHEPIRGYSDQGRSRESKAAA